jgi:hypothetical protein
MMSSHERQLTSAAITIKLAPPAVFLLGRYIRNAFAKAVAMCKSRVWTWLPVNPPLKMAGRLVPS